MKRFWAVYGFLPILLAVLLMAVGLSAPSAAAPGIDGTDVYQFPKLTDAPDPNETFALMNETRTRHGLSDLKANHKLALVAKQRAEDMASRQYYAHRNPEGSYYYDLFPGYDINAGFSCENLDLVFVASHELVISEWMSSLNGHRNCMMSANVTHAGYAATKMTLVNFDNSETTAYLVVAVHAFIEP